MFLPSDQDPGPGRGREGINDDLTMYLFDTIPFIRNMFVFIYDARIFCMNRGSRIFEDEGVGQEISS